MWRDAFSLPILSGVCVALAVFFFSVQSGLLEVSVWSGHDQAKIIGRPPTTSFNVRVTAGSPCNCSLDHQQYGRISSAELSIGCLCPSKDSTPRLPCPQQQQQKEAIGQPASCPPPVVQVEKVEEPWYAKGKTWHYPVQFPRCSMDACFNYSRCNTTAEDLLIYSYDEPAPPARHFTLINTTQWHTSDPDKACLFFVFLDTPGLFRPNKHPAQLLPHLWSNGLNHVLITFTDRWIQKGHPPDSIGLASVMISDMHQTTYRPGFDISIPLPGFRHSSEELRQLKPYERKYLLTFRGLRYVVTRNKTGEGALRSYDAFRQMHNGRDVIVVTSCKHPVNDENRREDPSLGAHCDEDDAAYGNYDFEDLMNSTFGLAPAGIQPNSYRFAEILSSGAIPVLVVDNYVKPFDSLVQWQRCILEFPSTEIHRILQAVRSMRRMETERRQAYCLAVYHRFFASDEALVRGAVQAQMVRFMGAFPTWRGDEVDELESLLG